MIRIAKRIWPLSAPFAVALVLSSCVAYEPVPAYPAYGYNYSPGYYYSPGPSFYFRYYDGPRHRHHWRG